MLFLPTIHNDGIDTAAHEAMKAELGVRELHDWGKFEPDGITPFRIEED